MSHASIFQAPDYDMHEEVHFFQDPDVGLKAIIAFHDKTHGPGGGGIRMWPYPSEAAALADALRLSRAMTFKLSMAGIRIGSCKSVIIGDPRTEKTEALLRSFGRIVESFGGRYFCAEDVGTGAEDLAVIAQETTHVVGLPGQDPSPGTAWGLFHAVRATVERRLERSPTLEGVTLGVQGLGKVGMRFCAFASEAGARLLVSDLDATRVSHARTQFGAEPVSFDELIGSTMDVFVPCALGEVLDDSSISTLKAKAVCGGTNNPLAEARHGRMLHERGVLYVPDYLSNSGGVMMVAGIRTGKAQSLIMSEIEARLYARCHEVFDRAAREKAPVSEVADRMVQEDMAEQHALRGRRQR